MFFFSFVSFLLFHFLLFLWDSVSQCHPAWPGTCSPRWPWTNRNSPASAPQMSSLCHCFYRTFHCYKFRKTQYFVQTYLKDFVSFLCYWILDNHVKMSKYWGNTCEYNLIFHNFVYFSSSADHKQDISSYNCVEPESPNQATITLNYFLWSGRFSLFIPEKMLTEYCSLDTLNIFACHSFR